MRTQFGGRETPKAGITDFVTCMIENSPSQNGFHADDAQISNTLILTIAASAYAPAVARGLCPGAHEYRRLRRARIRPWGKFNLASASRR